MIRTERLIIRPFEESDRTTAVNLLMDAGFMAFALNGPFDEAGAHRRFNEIRDYANQGLGKNAVVEKATQEIIGYCGIEPFELDGRTEYELGYRIIPSKRNNGFATEAATAIASHYVGRLYAYVEEKNRVSIKVLNNAGFVKLRGIQLYNKAMQLYLYVNDYGP